MSTVAEPAAATAPVRGPRRGAAALHVGGGVLAAALALVPLGLAVAHDLPAGQAVAAALAVVLTQAVPGVVVWRCVRPVRGWWLEDVGMGVAVGIALGVGTQVVAGSLHSRPLSLLGAPAVAALLLAVPATRRRVRAARTEPLPWWTAPLVVAPVGWALPSLVDHLRTMPLSWPSGFRRPYVDMPFHQAIAGELAHRGPGTMPFAVREPLAYHWFSHAWVAQVSQSSGVPIDAVLLRVLPALVGVMVVLAVAAAALRLSAAAGVAVLAAWLVMGSSDLSPAGLAAAHTPLALASPSLGLSQPLLAGVVGALAVRWRGAARAGSLAVLALLATAAAGTKGSTLPIAVAGAALAAGLLLVLALAARRGRGARLRATAARPALDLLVLAGCLAAASSLVLKGTTAGLRFDPGDATARLTSVFGGGTRPAAGLVAASAAFWALGYLARGAGLAGIALRGARRDPALWLLVGGSVAGAAAVLCLVQFAGGEFYFARNAQVFLAIGSAVGVGALLARRPRWAVLLVAVAAGTVVAGVRAVLYDDGAAADAALHRAQAFTSWLAALLLVGVVVGVAVARAGERRRAALVVVSVALLVATVGSTVASLALRYEPAPEAGPVSPRVPLAVSRDLVDAARWVRDSSGANDLLATNRHCVALPPSPCDPRRFALSAYSERRVLVEGWGYTPRANAYTARTGSYRIPYWRPELVTAQDDFVEAPSTAGADRLRGYGVRWVVVDTTAPHAPSLEPFATLRFQRPGAEVYELSGR